MREIIAGFSGRKRAYCIREAGKSNFRINCKLHMTNLLFLLLKNKGVFNFKLNTPYIFCSIGNYLQVEYIIVHAPLLHDALYAPVPGDI